MKKEHFEHIGTEEEERALLRLVLELLYLIVQDTHLFELLYTFVILCVLKFFILIILFSCLINCLSHFSLHMCEFFEKLQIGVFPHIYRACEAAFQGCLVIIVLIQNLVRI